MLRCTCWKYHETGADARWQHEWDYCADLSRKSSPVGIFRIDTTLKIALFLFLISQHRNRIIIVLGAYTDGLMFEVFCCFNGRANLLCVEGIASFDTWLGLQLQTWGPSLLPRRQLSLEMDRKLEPLSSSRRCWQTPLSAWGNVAVTAECEKRTSTTKLSGK